MSRGNRAPLLNSFFPLPPNFTGAWSCSSLTKSDWLNTNLKIASFIFWLWVLFSTGMFRSSQEPASSYSLLIFFPYKALESKNVKNIYNFDEIETRKISFSIFLLRNIQFISHSAYFSSKVSSSMSKRNNDDWFSILGIIFLDGTWLLNRYQARLVLMLGHSLCPAHVGCWCLLKWRFQYEVSLINLFSAGLIIAIKPVILRDLLPFLLISTDIVDGLKTVRKKILRDTERESTIV